MEEASFTAHRLKGQDVVVDEAYVDFSAVPSACCLVDKYPKLIVLQVSGRRR